MHLHTDNMVRFSCKCMAGSGYIQEQQQSPSEHTATRTTQIYHGSSLPSVIDALNFQRVTKEFTRLSILT